MPGHETAVAWTLGEKPRRPTQDVRSEDCFYRIENARVPDDVVDPWQQEMGTGVRPPGQCSALALDESLEASAQISRLVFIENRDRIKVAVLVIEPHLRVGESLSHRQTPIGLASTRF